VHLTDLTKGQYFGGNCFNSNKLCILLSPELALLTKKPRAASIHAVGEVVCAG